MNSQITEALFLAIVTLSHNKVRTFLSVLGMAIGIMSIVVIMSAGVSLRHIFDQQLAMFGSDYVQVEIKVPNASVMSSENATGRAQGISITTLTLDDKKKIDALSNIKHSYGAVLGQAVMSSQYNEKRVNYFAVSYEFSLIDTGGMKAGRFFTEDEDRGLSKVVVIGSQVADTLFPLQDPIGQSIKIQNVYFRIIGVMKERGSGGFANMDEWAFIPIRTAQKLLLGYDHLLMIMAQMKDPKQDRSTADDIVAVMRDQHQITDPKKDDFAVTTQAEASNIIGTILGGITLVLTIIASIALIVGGVGIMNIMYVAVNERVFEIGLRKAVGATIGHIKRQFLIEAIVITLIGAVFGIILAFILILVMYFFANKSGFSWPLAFSYQSMLLSIAFSSLVGLFFGYYPAKRASELRPVESINQRGS